MKKIIFMLLVFAATTTTFTACSSDDEPYFTATENDAPRILNTDIPDWSNGKPGTITNIDRNTNFKYDIIVTPADYTTVSWYLDDVKIAEGKSIDKAILAGEYTLRIVATTAKGLETSRTCLLVVRPCEGDPVAAKDIELERLVISGSNAILSGDNMDKVNKVVIDDQEADATYNSSEKNVSYTIPATIADGKHTLTLKDSEGNIYGAGYIITASSTSVLKSTYSGRPTAQFTMKGQAMDKIKTVSIDGKSCEITDKQPNSITVSAPDIELGKYSLTAVDEDGKTVNFLDGYKLVETATFAAISEEILWTGSHNVTWGTPFTDLQYDLINHITAGTTLRVYVNGNGQGTAATAWWSNILTGLSDPNRGDIMISGEMVLNFVLTDKSISLLNEQDGFLVVGDGYTVTKVTIE